MTILSEIKSESLKARKDRNVPKISLLSTLLSDVQMIGKNNGNRDATDAEAISIIKKMIVNAQDTIGILENMPDYDNERLEGLRYEVEILNTFLPQQLSNDQLSLEIDKLIALHNATSIKDMGKVMKTLKDEHSGKYDGSLASKLFKEKISQS